MSYIIQYSLLEKFRETFSDVFTYIDVPYVIEKGVSSITIPDDRSHLVHDDDHVYVGSAEQSFIAMMLKGELPKGNYQTITICTRDEPSYNHLHLKCFMKLELYSIDIQPLELAEYVKRAYNQHDSRKYRIIETKDNCYDIICNDIEVGSFGIRNPIYPFTYGTGLALPRFTNV